MYFRVLANRYELERRFNDGDNALSICAIEQRECIQQTVRWLLIVVIGEQLQPNVTFDKLSRFKHMTLRLTPTLF